MAAVPVPSPPLLASHAAVRAAASNVASFSAKRGRLTSDHPPQVAALRRGDWVKLICGASFEDAADVRNLSLVYTLAGVDCIDCAADASVVGAVNEGIDVAASIVPAVQRPWVMVSVNDDFRDLHFRKAEFDPEDCPLNCSRPCEKVCPADAISLVSVMVGGEQTQHDPMRKFDGGVITERCYGCGRCLPVCPYDRIRTLSYTRDPTTTAELLKRSDVDAVEIHTTGKGTDMFNTLWNSLSESINYVKLVALDGRPMSGDIGRGATRETVSFAVHMASMTDRPPGFYQLAGGTNSYTIDSLKKAGLFKSMTFHGNSGTSEMASSQQALIGGIAYGGYARKIVGQTLRKIPAQFGRLRIEDHPDHLLEGLREALSLVGPVKGYPSFKSMI